MGRQKKWAVRRILAPRDPFQSSNHEPARYNVEYAPDPRLSRSETHGADSLIVLVSDIRGNTGVTMTSLRTARVWFSGPPLRKEVVGGPLPCCCPFSCPGGAPASGIHYV